MNRRSSNSRTVREGIAERIKDIMAHLKEHSGTVRADWMELGAALSEAKETLPDTKAFGKWAKEIGLGHIDQATRSAAMWMYDNPKKVELVHKDTPTLSSPKRIREAFNALVKKAIKIAIATAAPSSKVAAALDLTVEEVDKLMDAALQSRDDAAQDAAAATEAQTQDEALTQDAPGLIAAGLRLLQPVRDADLQSEVLDQLRHELDIPEKRVFFTAETSAEEIIEALLGLSQAVVLQVVKAIAPSLSPEPAKPAKPAKAKPATKRPVRGRRKATPPPEVTA